MDNRELHIDTISSAGTKALKKKTPPSRELYYFIARLFIVAGVFVLVLSIRPVTVLFARLLVALAGDEYFFREYPVHAFTVAGRIVAFVLICSGSAVYILRKEWIISVTFLVMILSVIVMLDRSLFILFGTGLWMYDPVTVYRHRPNTVGTWGTWGDRFSSKFIYINEHGHHDDSFPVRKQSGELRGLVLGDSIVMGHGVEKGETFVNMLEKALYRHTPERAKFSRFQIINAGVQGYSTYQEYHHLLRNLKLSPDFVILGFCMNDVVEPFEIDAKFGGVGIDYHRIIQKNTRLLSWFLNETGFGRTIRHLQGGTSEEMRVRNKERARIKETMNVEYMATHPDAARILDA